MIDLHYWPTPNGWKISIALEELGLPYRVVPVNIGRGEQFQPEFLAISPNNRMPAIVDRAPADGGKPISVFESGAILLYLADKTGRLCPRDLRGRTEVQEWLMWQMGGLGPMSGQANHFRNYAPEKIAYGIDRYTNEVNRLYGVLDKRLAGRDFICGDFSIADCASWPWLLSHERLGQTLAEFPNLRRWYDAVKERPSVRRGIDVGKELRTPGTMDEQAKKILFGQTAKSVAR
ncbi:MAG TPA: glutathione S-transferase N-terminal domain-containing protein [Myxococcota bacterium]|nr:glutathione S-transferase N-terminal domain-containing protein [Myxococcota bacterium]